VLAETALVCEQCNTLVAENNTLKAENSKMKIQKALYERAR
jgi:cell division protein FtsB